MFQPSELPDGIILLITDELAAPADFFLHRTLATHLKERQNARALILSVSEGITRWKVLASKSNVNIQQHLDAGSLDFVDVLSEVQSPSSDSKVDSSLRILLDRVQAFIDKAPGYPPLIILDDITMLEWIGFPALDIKRFSRALRSVCLKAKATLFIRHHNIKSNEPDDLFRSLLQICNYHLEVRPLASGRSGDVSGEISLHPGFSSPITPIRLSNRSTATQYKLTDVGPLFFAKGTSAGVL